MSAESSSEITPASTEDLEVIFRTIDPSKLHTSQAALEEFHKRTPLPTCGICVKNPDECKLDPRGSYRCARCVSRKEECSWKGDIAVIELLRLFPRLTPFKARDAYNRWLENSRRKRQRLASDDVSDSSTKRKRSRAPYRTWTGVSAITTPIPDLAPPVTSTADITTLDDLNAFNYSTLKREKETAESARRQMAQSLEAALRKIDVLEQEIQRLKSQLVSASLSNSTTASESAASSQSLSAGLPIEVGRVTRDLAELNFHDQASPASSRAMGSGRGGR